MGGLDQFLDVIPESKESYNEIKNKDKILTNEIKKYFNKTSPFEFINSITKKLAIPEREDDYVPYTINMFFSMHIDTIYASRTINLLGEHITPRMQYDYYYHTITKGYRKWWLKKEKVSDSDNIEIIQKIYSVNIDKASTIYKFLDKNKPNELKALIDRYKNRKGGL